MASRSTGATAQPLDARLDELVKRFIDRPGYPALSYAEGKRLRDQIEMEVLFGLLGAFTSTVAEYSRPLTKKRLFNMLEDALTRAMARETARAADLAPAEALAGGAL